MAKESINYDFYIKIDFEKGSRNPSRIFTTMSNLVETFQIIDMEFSKTIDSKINSILLLEDIVKKRKNVLFVGQNSYPALSFHLHFVQVVQISYGIMLD